MNKRNNKKQFTPGKKGSVEPKSFNRSKQNRNNSSKRGREVSEIEDTAIAESKSNPYSPWYDKYPYFTKDAGTIGFAKPVGENLQPEEQTFMSAPGLMRLLFYPTIGYSADRTSAINRSTIRFYTYLRTVMKSANRYDPADVMMHNMAVDSAYMYLALMKRAYRCANLFSPLNKYYPKYLMRLAGFDDETICKDLAAFRAYINRFALQIQAYVVPKDFEITARHMWMCEGLYLDSDTTRAQTFMFVPDGFWKFNNTVTTGSQLEWVPWIGASADNLGPVTVHTLDQVMAIGDSLINAIVGDEDTGNISGDMVLVYGENGVRRAEELQDMSIILPVYDKTVLSQIENATLTGVFDPSYTPVITQDPSINNGAILFTPKFTGSVSYITWTDETKYYVEPIFGNRTSFINMHDDTPDYKAVIEATRFKVACSNPVSSLSTTEQAIQPDAFGADVIATMSIATFTNPAGVKLLTTSSNAIWDGTNTGTPSQSMSVSTQVLALNAAFDWSPDLWLYHITDDGAETELSFPAFDIDNIVPITFQQLSMMHEASMLSLLDVPNFRA